MTVSVAAPNTPQVKPAFIVQKLEGKRTKEISSLDDEGKIVKKTVEVDAGFMVSFPIKGNSIHVADEAELKRLGFDKTIPLLKGDGSDETVLGHAPNDVLTKE